MTYALIIFICIIFFYFLTLRNPTIFQKCKDTDAAKTQGNIFKVNYRPNIAIHFFILFDIHVCVQILITIYVYMENCNTNWKNGIITFIYSNPIRIYLNSIKPRNKILSFENHFILIRNNILVYGLWRL